MKLFAVELGGSAVLGERLGSSRSVEGLYSKRVLVEYRCCRSQFVEIIVACVMLRLVRTLLPHVAVILISAYNNIYNRFMDSPVVSLCVG